MHPELGRALSNEKVRYLLGGAWNTFFSWAIFAIAWWVASDWSNLWVISGIAHLAATTQSFWIQRHLVFRATHANLWAQYLRFQFVYLALFGVVGFFLNALHAQGIHPLIAQVFALMLAAVCGFALGKSFIYGAQGLSPRALVHRFGGALHGLIPAIAAFGMSLAAFELIWGGRFFPAGGLVGSDFGLPSMLFLEGKFWLQSNGWVSGLFNPPWFSPAWCAGTAFYADPQMGFYSPMQWMGFFVDPITAVHWNGWLFAAVAYWGSYALARKVLGWNRIASVVFATLGMANAFAPQRAIYGQAGYQHLYLWTVLALSLCWPAIPGAKASRRLLWPSLGVALCLTAWLQFGFAGMMIPAFLGTLLFCLALVVLGHGNLRQLIARATLGGLAAMLLNASKLFESISFMRNFPRDFYEPFGFVNFGDVLVSIARALIQPSEWTSRLDRFGTIGVLVPIPQNEWALHFGLGALSLCLMACIALVLQWPSPGRWRLTRAKVVALLGIGAAALFYARPGSDVVDNVLLSLTDTFLYPEPGTTIHFLRTIVVWPLQFPAIPWVLAIGIPVLLSARLWVKRPTGLDRNARLAQTQVVLALACMVCIAIIPPALLSGHPAVQAALKQIPILSSTTWTMRWIVIYLPLVQLLLALPAAAWLAKARVRPATFALCAAVPLIWMGPATEPMTYFVDRYNRAYDSHRAIAAFEQAASSGQPIPIRAIEVRWHNRSGIDRNDTMFDGISQGICYNPIYGYALEGFPQPERLEHGKPLSVDLRGQSLLFNPACLVHPEENACRPGDGFDMADPHQARQAERFLDRKPFEWRRPAFSTFSSWLSQLFFWAILALATLRLWRLLLQCMAPLPERDKQDFAEPSPNDH